MARQVRLSSGILVDEDGTPIPVTGFTGTISGSTGLVTAILPLLKATYTATSTKSATTLYITTDTGGIFLGSTTIVAGT